MRSLPLLHTTIGVVWVTLCSFFGHQFHELGAGHLAQHAGRHRIGLVVVADVDVQPVHHIEMRVGKEFFHGGVAHLGPDAALHERLEVGLGGQLLHILERGQRGSRCRRMAPVLDGSCGAAIVGQRGCPLDRRGLAFVLFLCALRQA